MPQTKPLYKFLDATAALKTIEEGYFKVSQFLELNDPFEGIGAIGFDGIPEQNIAKIKSKIQTWSREWNDEYGLISFSENPHDPVLWGHYADKHRGVAIEVMDSNSATLNPVAYDKTRIQLNPEKIVKDYPQRDEYWDGVIQEILKRKAKSWDYEKESRYILPLDQCAKVNGGMYFWKIPDNYITRIILGINCPYRTDYFARSLIARGVEGIEVLRAEKDQVEFKINF